MSHLTELLQLIHNEFESCQSLAEALEQEKNALETRKLANLQQTLCRKAEMLTKIEEIRENRNTLLQNKGLDKDEKALRNYLETLQNQEAADCLNALNSLNEKIIICRKYNELNGLLIFNSRKRNQHQLDIMRGAPNEKNLYDARGRAAKIGTTKSTRHA